VPVVARVVVSSYVVLLRASLSSSYDFPFPMLNRYGVPIKATGRKKGCPLSGSQGKVIYLAPIGPLGHKQDSACW
jgi:hypothetical protein